MTRYGHHGHSDPYANMWEHADEQNRESANAAYRDAQSAGGSELRDMGDDDDSGGPIPKARSTKTRWVWRLSGGVCVLCCNDKRPVNDVRVGLEWMHHQPGLCLHHARAFAAELNALLASLEDETDHLYSENFDYSAAPRLAARTREHERMHNEMHEESVEIEDN